MGEWDMAWNYAVVPIAKVLVMCITGFLLAIPRIGILSANGIQLLSKLVFALFLPCLIFTQLGSAITYARMLQWWFIPVNVLLSAVLGCFIGWLVFLIARPPAEFKMLTIFMTGIGNIGNIPLVIVHSFCDNNIHMYNPFHLAMETCKEDGVAFITFGQWVGAVIVYTFVYRMLSQQPQPQLTHTESKLHIIIDVDEGDVQNENTSESMEKAESFFTNSMEHLGNLTRVKLTQAMHTVGVILCQPPVVASILALVFGPIPFFKSMLFTEDAPFSFVTDSLNILGQATIPCIMLTLGGNLVGGPGHSSKLGMRTTMAITVVRLFVIPIMGIALVFLFGKLGVFPADNALFRFVLLLQHTMPTSILVGAVAALQGVVHKEAASVLFWEHLLALASITIWLIIYLNLVRSEII